ncbi:hypothetical protein ES319_D01G241300v1 [Gossypium barbadense]|uniref:Uncharacterized protein n=2 Tax=Gossypium TaxID=3633 RepID=A0A5J5SUS9_GOSBA|nr:hypothetical protein ES319_D01G241300v1 [Gossypium barbadense]PPD70045.1 hypothetical protein GOBAR_DD33074 [Gossypium barbadense]TYG84540.1 hypothetical protein ES288_D01G258000v1 [Gossypium darwinii]
MSSKQDYWQILQKRLKKPTVGKKKVRKLKLIKATMVKMREEMTQLVNMADNCHRRIVEAREEIRAQLVAADTRDALINEFICSWIDKNDSD